MNKTLTPPSLYDYQETALLNMTTGKVLNGDVGSGKSRTGIAFYFTFNGGKVNTKQYCPMKRKQNLLIITTAAKKNSKEWDDELAVYGLKQGDNAPLYPGLNVVVDSWNCCQKYIDLRKWFVIWDEQHLCSLGKWSKTFLKLSAKNDWIILSGTPGDCYMDYLVIWLARGFFRSKTEFQSRHVVYSRWSKFPKIERYIGIDRLEELKAAVLVVMRFDRPTRQWHDYVTVDYNKERYRYIMRNRFDPYSNEPIENASALCYALRRSINTDPTRIDAVYSVLDRTNRVIIFYNLTAELDLLKESISKRYGDNFIITQYNGKVHDRISTEERWVHLVQMSACEAWNCITCDTMILFSQGYSYKQLIQACGRIDRTNTKYVDLHYIHLVSKAPIDMAIKSALSKKKDFNEKKFFAK